jgi:signal transduction histidine kinase
MSGDIRGPSPVIHGQETGPAAEGRESSARRSLLRAGIFFGILLLLDLAVISLLLFRDLDKRTIVDSLSQAYADAARLAESVGKVSAPAGGFDYFRILERERVLYRVFNEFMARRQVVRHIEVKDSAGNTVLRLKRGETKVLTAPDELPFGFAPPAPEGPLPTEPGSYVYESPVRDRLVRVPMPGGPVGATLQVGVAEEALEEEARELRRGLLIRLAVGGLFSLLILAAAFTYVLRLLRRVRRAEAEHQIAGRLAYVGTLASGLAHEIRNPLNAMNMNLQMLEEEMGGQEGDVEAVGLLTASRAEVRRLEQLVQDFLAYARPSATSRELQDPLEAVTTVVEFLQPQFEEARIHLDHHHPPRLPEVALDADQFRQALLNVLQNALQASPAGSRVSVHTSATSENGVQVEVEDRGPGIPPDRLEQIFEVFYSERPGGTGLGLPIAQRVLESHGGRIDIRSQVGEGTTITLTLPPVSKGPGPGDRTAAGS